MKTVISFSSVVQRALSSAAASIYNSIHYQGIHRISRNSIYQGVVGVWLNRIFREALIAKSDSGSPHIFRNVTLVARDLSFKKTGNPKLYHQSGRGGEWLNTSMLILIL